MNIRKSVLDAVSGEERLEAARKMQEHITHAQVERKVRGLCEKFPIHLPFTRQILPFHF